MQLEEDTWYYIQGSDAWTSEEKEVLVNALRVHGFQYEGVIDDSTAVLIKRDEVEGLTVMCDTTMDSDTPLYLEV